MVAKNLRFTNGRALKAEAWLVRKSISKICTPKIKRRYQRENHFPLGIYNSVAAPLKMLFLKHSNIQQMQNTITYLRQSTLNMTFNKTNACSSCLIPTLNKQGTWKAEYSLIFLQTLNPFWKFQSTNLTIYPVWNKCNTLASSPKISIPGTPPAALGQM